LSVSYEIGFIFINKFAHCV